MIEPFEDRVVAFLDILGFSAFVERAEKVPGENHQLRMLRNVLDRHVLTDNDTLDKAVPEGVKPRYLFLSDTVIISSKVRDGKYSGLVAVTVKTIQLAHQLFEMGFLIRGAVAVGPVWHDDRNIFGTGYIAAYRGEQCADSPRVVLVTSANELLGKTMVDDTTLSEWGLVGEYEGDNVVETLNPYLIRGLSLPDREKLAFGQYRSFVLQSLEKHHSGTKEREKWEWMARFYNRALNRWNIDCAPISAAISRA